MLIVPFILCEIMNYRKIRQWALNLVSTHILSLETKPSNIKKLTVPVHVVFLSH